MPAIEKLYEEYGDQIVIVGVNVGEDEDTIDTFIEAKKLFISGCLRHRKQYQ